MSLHANTKTKTWVGIPIPRASSCLVICPWMIFATAINEAMTRLRAGESGLAIHPGCGTNLAASTLLPATFAWAPFQGVRSLRWRLLLIPVALMFAVFGYLLSKPLGPWLQRNVTTEADLGNMQVMDIVSVRKGVHRVITK